jgi:predicted nuclease of predicted toxin-antitoxin system
MRFLIDANLSPRIAEALTAGGYPASHVSPDGQAALLLANLPSVTADLEAGAVVSLTRFHLRVRRLPI